MRPAQFAPVLTPALAWQNVYWAHYHGSPAQARYSKPDQANTSNVGEWMNVSGGS